MLCTEIPETDMVWPKQSTKQALLWWSESAYLPGASAGPAQPEGQWVCMDPAGGDSSHSYTLDDPSEESKACSLGAGANGESQTLALDNRTNLKG